MSLRALMPREWRRRRLARTLPDGALRRFYAVPFPTGRRAWHEVEYVALDLETTGTDPRTEEIVSFGWVVLRGAAVDLSTATRRMARTSKAMPERSAVIHAITDDEAGRGEPACAVLQELLAVLAGRVLIAHFAPAERGFLDAACRRCFDGGLVVPTVDTLQLARRRHLRRDKVPARGELRLAALRESYNLPAHPLHDALSDALAAAELFLAQAEEASDPAPVPLRELLAYD